MPKQLTGVLSSVPGSQFIPVSLFTDNYGGDNAVLAYAFHKLKHVVIIKHIVQVIGKIVDQPYGDFLISETKGILCRF